MFHLPFLPFVMILYFQSALIFFCFPLFLVLRKNLGLFWFFSISEKRNKILEKRRGTGIMSLFGSICSVSKSRGVLEKMAKDINIKIKPEHTRMDICELIKNRLLFLEKYSTDEKKNKFTYVMIPRNHASLPFPLNLQDRVRSIQGTIKDKIKFKLDAQIKQIKQKIEGEDVISYIIEITNGKNLDEFKDFLELQGAILEGKKWIININ